MDQYLKHPFIDQIAPICWSELKPSRIGEDIDVAIALAEADLRRIESIPASDAGYENVFMAFEDAGNALSEAWSKIEHLNNVMDSAELRDAYNAALPKVIGFFSAILRRPALWASVQAAAHNSSRESVSPLQRRHMDEILADFRESGADLDEAGRNRLGEIDSELAQLTQTYSENVLDATNEWELIVDDQSVLDGFPDVSLEAARLSALEKGYGTEQEPKWRFTLKGPSFGPFMRFSNDPVLREKAWRAACAVGAVAPRDNGDLVVRILKLRKEKASILGKAHYADYSTSRRMARSGSVARSFLIKLRDVLQDAPDRELDDLARFRAEKTGDAVDLVEPWDLAWWSEKLRRSAYDFDEESLRPWFSIDRVISGMFQLAETLFGLSINARPTYVGRPDVGQSNGVEVWHEQVGYYDVFDRDSGRLLGGFFTDWFPRESKRSGAWMDTLRQGEWGESGPVKPHLVVLCGNLTPPDADGLSLLTHDEVTTIFHEFGHLLHQICGRVPVRSLNGISVAWDFVELPSQLLENWCWERESLDLFARHHLSGQPIPEDLFRKMIAARNFQEGLGILRQLALGILDLELHISFIGSDGEPVEDLESFATRAIANYRPTLKTQSPPIHRNFGHLFGGGGGYAAGYYSYKWSEVLEADVFGGFKEHGVLNAEIGRRFRDCILSVGKSIEPMDAFIAFRGRTPSLAPYLKRSGLLTDEEIRISDPARFQFGTSR